MKAPHVYRVPLSFAWLSENEMLREALAVKGWVFISVDKLGATYLADSQQFTSAWDDNILFELDELKRLGFK